uniref:Uncharacterized protein n=1 Tax=Panagrolaimus superbus TaxID=310955 RepID=A0A914Y5R5_9BILA
MIARLRRRFESKSRDSVGSPPTSPGFGKSLNFQCVICFESYPSQEGFIVCKPFEAAVTSPRDPHKLCIDCIRGHCHAAIDDMALAPGGIGLRCPDPNCKNVLHFADFKFYLGPEDHERLEKRMQHESVTSASLSDLVAESKLSEIVVRVCHRCNVQYVKQDGCNKMT